MSGGLEKVGHQYTQRLGNDIVYGDGSDGTVVISTNTSLSRDMYYNNLTINSGVHLNTNGFRVFVKNTLTLNGSIGIKTTDSLVSTGTVSGNTSNYGSVSYSIGGSTQTNTTTQIPASLMRVMESAVSGIYIANAGSAYIVAGGAGGPDGSNGTLDTNTAAPTTWPGKSGSAGSAGSAGQYPPNAHSVGADGGQGYSGATGSDGSAGTAGTYGTAGTGGAGGYGGGVVLIVAKTISGSGTVYSQGKTGSAGTAAVNGTAGSTGSAGSPGGTGSSAPGAHGTGFVNNYWHSYPTHHSGTPAHGTPLPHYHFPGSHYTHLQWHHSAHYYAHNGGNNGGHTHGDAAHHGPDGRIWHLNSVDHNHTWSPSNTGGNPHAGGYSYNYGYSGHGHNHGHYYTFNPRSGGRAHHDTGRYHYVVHGLSAGPAMHSHTYTFTYPGGAGGAGGAGGTGGPGGRAGTPTAGGTGYPGGGGGIIMLTDATPSVTLDTSGATSNSYTANNGMQILVLNT